MYIKIRKIAGDSDDLVINITKITTIINVKNKIKEILNYPVKKQKLFYQGKELTNHYRVMDYNLHLNDVILLNICQNINELSTSVSSDTVEENIVSTYSIGDFIDVRCTCYGAWFEGVITSIKKSKLSLDLNMSNQYLEHTHVFHVQLDHRFNKSINLIVSNFDDIRPRADYIYKFDELTVGKVVMVNYNIEYPKERGYWYDLIIEKLNPKSKTVMGKIMLGKKMYLKRSCRIKFVNEIMRIEKHNECSEKQEATSPIPLRTNSPLCHYCNDDTTKKCKECGCKKCAGNTDPNLIVLCDECNDGYHIYCLKPALNTLPDDEYWYCPECKNDSKIVRVGDELPISEKRRKMPAYTGVKNQMWGRGMACVGRTKECTIVPLHHYGPIPGIEVGTCWKFRVQVSEAGVHRPCVAGIHGREGDGAYSIVLSGGYEDDVDNGDEFIYTGSGGRDFSGNKRNAEQSFDQTMSRMNKALALNCNVEFNGDKGAESFDWKRGRPVRVVRNFKLAKYSPFAPKEGNRYDGIYKVVKYYKEKGKSGFYVWKYLLRRDDPAPSPWSAQGQQMEIIYPDGYIEAKQPVQNGNLVINNSNNRSKKAKLTVYILEKNVQKLINSDVRNKKHWQECGEQLKNGKMAYIEKVQEVFRCVCCQEVTYQPVTTVCKHNTCLSCLQRSFQAEIYVCPSCRYQLNPDKVHVNITLSRVLSLLLPGYDKTR